MSLTRTSRSPRSIPLETCCSIRQHTQRVGEADLSNFSFKKTFMDSSFSYGFSFLSETTKRIKKFIIRYIIVYYLKTLISRHKTSKHEFRVIHRVPIGLWCSKAIFPSNRRQITGIYSLSNDTFHNRYSKFLF